MPSAKSELVIVIAGAIITSSPLALAGPGDALVREGNRALEAEDFSQALILYERAAEADPALAEAFYNRAVALTLQEEFDAARELYRSADELATNNLLRTSARFNMGLGLYRAGQAAVTTDADAAIERFFEAAQAFKDVLRLDPADQAAAQGVELSRRAIQLIRDQQALQEELEKLAQEQQQQADGEQGEQPQQGEGESPESQEEQSQDQQGEGQEPREGEQPGGSGTNQSQKQQELQDRTKKAEQTLEQSREQNVSLDPEKNQQAEDALEQAIEEQQKAQESMDKGDSDQTREHQQSAADRLKEALEKMQEAMEEQQGQSQDRREQRQNQQQQQNQNPSQEEGDSEEPVDELTQQLLEKEAREHDMRRGYLEQIIRGVAPIEKDW